MYKLSSMPLPLVLALLLFCFQLKFCICTDTILSTQSIRDSDTIVSNNGNFKLGFFSPVNSTCRYVGIFFNIPILTPVWVANRDKPLNNSLGSLTISGDGNLVILDGRKTVVWSSNVRNSMANSMVRLLDTGNLVLQGSNFNETLTIWESFQHPTDSYLPKMMLTTNIRDNRKIMLTSWRSPSDPSVGRFSGGLDPLNIPQFFVWNGSRPIWRSGPWNGQIFTGVPAMSASYGNGFSIVDDKEGNASLTSRHPFQSLYLYLMLSSEGILSFKYWDKELQHWTDYGTTRDNYCDAYNRCGPYGICNSRSSPICSCLNGFEPMNIEEWSKGNWTSGCVRRTQLQCERNNTGENTREDGFLKVSKVKVPDFAEWLAVTDSCESECLNNCSCVAYAYLSGIGCMHWSGNLIDNMKLSDGGEDLFVRVAYSELGKKRSIKMVIIVTTIVLSISIPLITYFAWIYMTRIKGRKTSSEKSDYLMLGSTMSQVRLKDVHIYHFDKLVDATRNFQSENKLGQGGFGLVYKGSLPNGEEIAVKRLSRSSGQGIEEFMNEVVLISKLQHRNLVRLLGCCVEREEKMLIYEYMPNGSLDSHLFDPVRKEYLDWTRRVRIIEGIARGLLYLHRDSRLKIIHRDLKASNILLDHNLNPKISDFGMAKIFGGDQDQENTERVAGTYGYMAPEYAMEGIFSEKSDVYSFGVLLLEAVSGRRNSSFCTKEHPSSLLRVAWKLWNEEKILELIDQTIQDPRYEPEILRYVHVGLLCVQEFAEDRPIVSTVISMLTSETADLPSPKNPALVERQTSPENHACQEIQQVYSVNNVSITVVEGR